MLLRPALRQSAETYREELLMKGGKRSKKPRKLTFYSCFISRIFLQYIFRSVIDLH